jgi:hypothetical protein
MLTSERAVQLAKESLRQIGFDEQPLQLREGPIVNQIELPMPTERRFEIPFVPKRQYKLPYYDIFWPFPFDQRLKYGDSPQVAVQLSGLTKKVTMFANNHPQALKFALPTNYLEISNHLLASPPAPKPTNSPAPPTRR